MFAVAVVALSSLKLLFLPAYRSTDFEVHRNWLAITHSLPVKQWYQDTTSPWTLDYPPLFAWFEWLLSQFAVLFDPKMVEVSNLNYASDMTILFQRLSVIVVDFVYAYGCKLCSEQVERWCGRRGESALLPVFLMLLGNAGLVMVDHIHFQYNGLLYGILFLSIARLLQGREVESALWFCLLLNMKHIYLYVAPAYFVYLLRSYCLACPPEAEVRWRSFSLWRLVKLGVVVVAVFALSLGPFIWYGQLGQVVSRLFPFKRGLSHAYWAPNFWALYNFADKVLVTAGRWLGVVGASGATASMTAGLVQEYQHAVLPSVSPTITLVLTFLSLLPSLVQLWWSPHRPWQFVRVLVLCGFGSFMFGWHVHEKAILLVLLPLGLLSWHCHVEARLFLLLSVVGHFSLFPLLFPPQMTVIKMSVVLVHATYTAAVLGRRWCEGKKRTVIPCLGPCTLLETLYLLGLWPVLLYQEVGHALLGLHHSLPFLPLLLTSVYCAVGVTYCWISYYTFVLSNSWKKKKKTN